MYTGTTVQRHKDEDHRRALPVTDKDREWSRFCADDTCPRIRQVGTVDTIT